jgi:hypothetical protein
MTSSGRGSSLEIGFVPLEQSIKFKILRRFLARSVKRIHIDMDDFPHKSFRTNIPDLRIM